MAAEVTDGRVLTPRESEAVQRVEALKAAIDGHGVTAAQVADAASAVLSCRDWLYLPVKYASVRDCFTAEGVWGQWEKAKKPLERLVAGFRAAGLTQGQTAGLLGISQGRVSQLEHGKSGHEARSAGKNISHSPKPAPDQPEREKVAYIPPSAAPSEPSGSAREEIAPAPPPPVEQSVMTTTEASATGVESVPGEVRKAIREQAMDEFRARFEKLWDDKCAEVEALRAKLAGQLPEGASPCPECGGTGVEAGPA